MTQLETTITNIIESAKKNINIYLGKKDINKYFLDVCGKNNVTLAKYLYGFYDISSDTLDLAFINCCKTGKLDMLKLLHSLGVNVHQNGDTPFINACLHGQIETAKWLYSLGGVNVRTSSDAPIGYACCGGHKDIAEWLCSVGKYKKIVISFDDVFKSCCRSGFLDMAKWIYHNTKHLKFTLNDATFIEAFKIACVHEKLDIAQWLLTISDIDINATSDGETPIIACLEAESVKSFIWLYLNGAKINDDVFEKCNNLDDLELIRIITNIKN